MKLIKPSFEIIPLNPDPLKHIESIARICYKSEDKITEDSAGKFVKMLYDRGHHAMLEFYPFYFRMKTSLAMQLTYLNQLPQIDGDFKFYDRNIGYVTASCNLRTIISIDKYNQILTTNVLKTYPTLAFLFDRYRNEINIENLEVELDLQYATVKFITNRGVTHELVRHRKCSFAQESTRYCNYGGKDMEFIIPSWLNIPEGNYSNIDSILKSCNEPSNNDDGFIGRHSFSLLQSEASYKHLLKLRWTPQQARGILPNDLKTEIVVQARLSEWKHIFALRCAKTAHPDMREIMIPLRDEMSKLYPNYF